MPISLSPLGSKYRFGGLTSLKLLLEGKVDNSMFKVTIGRIG